MIPLSGNVYMADLPYAKHLQSGKRPVVVMQNKKGNECGPHVHVVPLTSRQEKAKTQPTHVMLIANEQNGLRMNSVALAEDLRPIPKENIMFHIGALTENELRQVSNAVKIHLEIG